MVMRFKGLLESRICSYYPHLSKDSIQIKNNHPVKKQHRSHIYQFDIYERKQFFKSLIIKESIFNPAYNNDIVKDTEVEFNNLRRLGKLSNQSFSICRVLDAIPQEGILISEKVEGDSLAKYLQKIAYLPITKNKKTFLKDIFRQVGGWLEQFHKAAKTGEQAYINTDEYIKKTEEIINKFLPFGLPKPLGEKIIRTMNELKQVAGSLKFDLALKHGDFQPRNIIIYKRKIKTLDIDSDKNDLAIKDVTNFIVGVKSSEVKSIYSFLNEEFMNELNNDFLKAYFGESVPYQAIQFTTLLGMLEFLESIYNRNKSGLKRLRIIQFYKEQLRACIKETEEKKYV